MPERSSKSTGRKSRSTTTCGRSRQPAITPSTSSAAASHARTSASPAREPDSLERGPVFGMSSLGSLASYDHATSSWRTSQLSLLEDSTPFSGRFPRSGMTRSGTLFQLVPLVPRIGASGCGLLPTPTAADSRSTCNATASRQPGSKHHSGVTLTDHVRLWPTPTSRGWKDVTDPRTWNCKEDRDRFDQLGRAVFKDGTATGGGSLNPTWVEWLMGFPLGWTALDASETPSSRRSSRSSGGRSSRRKKGG